MTKYEEDVIILDDELEDGEDSYVDDANSSGLEDTMSISKFVQTKKRLSRKLRYIQNTADPLPKNTYEVEGMQAEGNSLYYCLAPTDATDGSKFPQYIVSVDR